ncbi:hypothetical protein ABT369_39215 [Dactylosporangium sp. NPDC000244]|uniref:hypothetical protein n=1 Tax=Dactylosporangium sp. NPDC000244 TaxID=3154365 RepID=UPI003322E52E
MTARCVQSPIYALDCDGCGAYFEPTGRFAQRSENGARREAREMGWKVRPFVGKGARSAPDHCPACAATT